MTGRIEMLTGRCECGSVAFEVNNVRETVTVCHCNQCRRTSGHLWASTHAAFDDLTFTQDAGLKWYVSSETENAGSAPNVDPASSTA